MVVCGCVCARVCVCVCVCVLMCVLLMCMCVCDEGSLCNDRESCKKTRDVKAFLQSEVGQEKGMLEQRIYRHIWSLSKEKTTQAVKTTPHVK